MSKYRFGAGVLIATLYQFLIALVLLWITRFAFIAYNADSVDVHSFGEALRLSLPGIRFDISAALYFNSLFILMRILPFGFVYNRVYLRTTNWIYYIVNALMLAINIGDIPYYRFTGARLRWTNILNITTDSEIGSIIAHYAASYALFFVGGVLLIAMMVFLGSRVYIRRPRTNLTWWGRGLVFVLVGFGCFAGMRGRLGSGLPLAIPDAAFYVRTSPQINAVLNSPFCILRSLNRSKANTEPLLTFFSDAELSAIRNSVHTPADSVVLAERNIVTIIIESGGSTWIDCLNVSPDGGDFGLMPFLDSIAGESTVFLHTMACSRASAGGTTAVLGGFPAFDPFYFMLSPYNKNNVDTPATLLTKRGWDTAFFYGVKHGSFNIDQTAYAMGYKKIYNRDTYNNDSDYDGHWGIFDVPMASYVVKEMSMLAQPFAAVWFSVSAHGPFTLPDGFDTSVFRHPEQSPERGLEYTDLALRRFFEEAARCPWYKNTTFIITADHGNRDFKGTDFDTDYIRNHIPLIIYTPDGSMPSVIVEDRVLSQHDIPATTLAAIGYDEPYVSLGTSAFDADSTHIGIYRADGGRYFATGTRYGLYTSPDATKIEAVYDLLSDPTMKCPVESPDSSVVLGMQRRLQAFLQDYTHRLEGDSLALIR